MDNEIGQFVAFTAAPEATARGFLEMTNGDVMQAVQLFFDQPELQTSIAAASSAPQSAPFAPAVAVPTSSGRDRNNAITINSDDDDDDVQMLDSDDGRDDEEATVEHRSEFAAIRQAQEEEDARLAQQMQEDLYKQAPVDEHGVRAPIARTTETLVEPAYGGPAAMGYDEDDDEIRQRLAEMERRRRNMQQQQREYLI